MSGETQNQVIIKKLDELIDLVKKNGQNKVENHTHHHYPAQWPLYTGTANPSWEGSTYTYSSNDGTLAGYNVPTVPNTE